jgi:hypothetical protein
MAKSDVDAAVAAENTQGRSSMGRAGTAFTAPSAKPASGKLEGRKNTQAGDPAAQGQGTRANRPISAAERNGASHTIVTNIVKPNDPAAGMTMANSPVIPPVTHRGFESGIDSSY